MTETAPAALQKPRKRSIRRVTRRMGKILLYLFLVPLVAHAAWWTWNNTAWNWRSANWAPSGLLKPATADPEPAVYVLAGRTGGWKGTFAHHTWIVLKPAGDNRYTRYDVVGWGRPVRTDGWAADGRWYSDAPRLLMTLRGREAERAIPRIKAAVASYPFNQPGTYQAWPGPNSNTFVAHIARQVPELAPGLLPTALGKDFTGSPFFAGLTPSHTGRGR